MIDGFSVIKGDAVRTARGGGTGYKRRLELLGSGQNGKEQRVAAKVLKEGSLGLWFYRTFLASRFVQVQVSEDLGGGKLLFVNVKSLVKRTSINEEQIRGKAAVQAAQIIGNYCDETLALEKVLVGTFDRLKPVPLTKGLELGQLAGRGATKAVWRGVDRRNGEEKPAAIARIRRSWGFTNENALAWKYQASPFIVAPAEVVSSNKDFYEAVMPLYETDGWNLISKMKGDPQLQKQALRAMVDVARGLQMLHDDNLVHRDIKPDNFFFERDGEGKLKGVVADLGFVQEGESRSSSGTRGYKDVSGGTHGLKSGDIWGFGRSLGEMFPGIGDVQRLAKDMQNTNVEDRLTIDQVIARLEGIVRQSVEADSA